IRSIANYVSSGSILNPYTASRASFTHGTNVDQNLVTENFYNARGMLRKQIDPLDNVTLCGYDDAGRLVKTIRNAASVNYNNDYSGTSPDPSLAAYSASGNADQDIVSSQTYDKAGNRVKTVDVSGVVSYIVYDVVNRPVKTVRAAKDAATITLNVGDGGYIAANDPRSASYTADPAPDRDLIATTQYDKMGRVILTQRLLENRPTLEWETTLYGYDGLGRSVKVIKVASNAAYNIAADPTLASYSASANADLDIITRTAYDKAERVMYTEDNFGSKSWAGYDGLNRPVKNVINAVGTATDGSAADPRSATYVPNAAVDKDLVLVTAYNSDGRVQSVTDTLGRITRYVYDTVGRVTRTVQNFVDPGQDPSLWVYVNGWKKSDGTTVISNGTDNDQNIVSSSVYDGKGRAVQTIDHRNNITLTVYDTLDRQVMTIANYIVQGSSQPANWLWSSGNNRWEDGAGNAISFGTDNDQNRITSMTYDLLGRSLRMRDAAGIETRYTLDLLG
ncbi:MAG: RHS repeat domain-containing protein, partial [Chloroflexota bacterium]